MEKSQGWIPDKWQQEVISLRHGQHLVLAPPGCGKTQILAERIHQAMADGVSGGDMLCLTFTNRAARGMRERIDLRVGREQSEDVFVGNVHRFCSRFLFANNIVPAESAIIDDDTVDSILARYLNESEDVAKLDYRRKAAHAQIMFFSHIMFDISHGVGRDLRVHPESVTKEDVIVMKALAKAVDKPFNATLMIDIYDHADFYMDLIDQPVFPQRLRFQAGQTLAKVRYAHAYVAYKRQNNLIDFEDLLQLTYVALRDNPNHRRYPWIQVDEVQDLNMLQFAIINQLRADDGCFLYLGDEQQAIFSFMGAKLSTLKTIKEQCDGSVLHLGVNHRQPPRIVDMLNAYAVANLGSDATFMPSTSGCEDKGEVTLQVRPSENIWTEYDDVAKLTALLAAKSDSGTTAIVVNSNRDADEVSQSLLGNGIAHFKISGTDLFSTQPVKLLLAHLGVVNNELNSLAWAQILHGMKVCATAASARALVHKLRMFGLAPTDMLSDGKTYLRRFIDAYEDGDIVVFDTETTGLDVFEDDILQIAAERIRQGRVVDKFCVYMETSRPIPKLLGDIENPIIEERKHNRLLHPAEGLRAFLDFVGGSLLLAHNAAFDYNIMDFCLRRFLPLADWKALQPVCFDSLKLIRLLRPELKVYKLKSLLSEIGLEGKNSHLADDDVFATVSLVNYCFEKGKEMIAGQDTFLDRPANKDCFRKLRQCYADYYHEAVERLCVMKVGGQPALVDEMKRFYHFLLDGGWIAPLDKIGYVLRFISDDLVRQDIEPPLKQQLENHVMELSTLKEADLCGSASLDEKVFVSTIHKAKGLEFDNVIVFDVVDGRIPSFYSQNDSGRMAEDARKLYVALSRTRSRLYVCYSKLSASTSCPRPQALSRFMDPIKQFFDIADSCKK